MKYATFDTITVGQYQRLFEIGKSTDEDKDMQLVSVLTGQSLTQVEDMNIIDYNAACRRITDIFSTSVKGKPKRFIRIKGHRYRIIYNPAKLSAGRYVEVNTWLKGGVIDNINKIMASIIHPVGWWGQKIKPRLAHPELSEAITNCRFAVVHSACVFFSTLWTNSIKALVDSLEKWEHREMTVEQRQKMRKLLQIASGGFSAQNR